MRQSLICTLALLINGGCGGSGGKGSRGSINSNDKKKNEADESQVSQETHVSTEEMVSSEDSRPVSTSRSRLGGGYVYGPDIVLSPSVTNSASSEHSQNIIPDSPHLEVHSLLEQDVGERRMDDPGRIKYERKRDFDKREPDVTGDEQPVAVAIPETLDVIEAPPLNTRYHGSKRKADATRDTARKRQEIN